MKLVKISFILAIAVAALVGITTTSYAFHDGGVARCEGCHTMHNSFQSTVMTVDKTVVAGVAAGNKKWLLQGSDQSSTCLNCHGKGSATSGYHISTDNVAANALGATTALPNQFTPGGDFSWVKIRYKTAVTTGSGTGERHGHNIVAVDYSYTADATNTAAPGGSYLASELNCISCHDPHSNARVDDTGTVTHRDTAGVFPPIEASGSYGQEATAGYAVGVYRFLGGAGYKPMSSTGAAFVNEPPVAVAPSTYNRNESTSDTIVAYGTGMSQWCANCHGNFLNTSSVMGAGAHPHPAGAVITSTTIIDNYNHYIKTGDMSNAGNGYSSLVPIETGDGYAGKATLTSYATNAATIAPTAGTSVVMCLSCHRAHATAFDSMIRWYNSDAFITEDGAYFTSGNGNAPSTTALAQRGYYERPATVFADFQRVLCNKCHAKD